MVNVERNGQKMQYSGALYEDYLLLYEPGVRADSLIEAMNSFAAEEWRITYGSVCACMEHTLFISYIILGCTTFGWAIRKNVL